MLTQPIFEKLGQLRFNGMLKALEEQMQMPDINERDLCTTSKKIDVSIKIFRSCVNFLIKSPINSNKKDIIA